MAAKILILYKSASINFTKEQGEECAFFGHSDFSWNGIMSAFNVLASPYLLLGYDLNS